MRAAASNWIARRGWIVWGLVILVASVVPPEWVFGHAPETARNPLAWFAHLFEFGLFALLVALWRGPDDGLLVGALAAIAYGGAIELIQAPISYRSADWRDFLTDVLGVALALALLWYGRRRRARRGAPAAGVESAARGGGR